MAEVTQWLPRGAWAGIAAPGQIGAAGCEGVTVMLQHGYGLASLVAAPGQRDGLLRRLEERVGLALPATPRLVSSAACDAIGTGPSQWMLRMASRREMAALIAEWAPHAAISDQSDARAALRLSGPHLRETLAKGVMLDLHPAAFAVGDAAGTSVAHIGIHLWRLPDGPEGPVFEIMVPRSYAGSFWSWLGASAAEFGCRIIDGRG